MVNVVDLMRLQPEDEHPHGLSDREFDAIFTPDKPVIFAYHGYPWLIHRLTYRRTNHANIHVRGYKEEGTTTTPFDMVMLNDLDRFHLVIDVHRPRARVSAPGPRSCGRRWSTSGCDTARTHANTARTRPTCAAGRRRTTGTSHCRRDARSERVNGQPARSAIGSERVSGQLAGRSGWTIASSSRPVM